MDKRREEGIRDDGGDDEVVVVVVVEERGDGGIARWRKLPVGFTLPPALPQARCALAAPFHPYPAAGFDQV
jgi:hypothetical protein